jgi:hypothetical protein
VKYASHLFHQLPVEFHACVHSMCITEHSLLHVLVFNFISIMMSRIILVYIETLLCLCVCACVRARTRVHTHTHIHTCIINPLGLELSTQCTPRKTQTLSSCPSLCMFSADHFSEFSVFTGSHCTLTVVDFWCQRVEEICS